MLPPYQSVHLKGFQMYAQKPFLTLFVLWESDMPGMPVMPKSRKKSVRTTSRCRLLLRNDLPDIGSSDSLWRLQLGKTESRTMSEVMVNLICFGRIDNRRSFITRQSHLFAIPNSTFSHLLHHSQYFKTVLN